MTLETILRTVLYAIAWSALVAFCGVVAGVGVRWMLRLLGHALAETGRRCGKWASVSLASLALVCVVVAQKANTNDAPNGVSASAPMMSGAMGTIAPPVDWAQSPSGAQSSPAGALSLGAQSSRLRERPATAQDVPQWKLRGAYDDAIRIPADGWDFRTPDGFVEGMTVFSRGEFRPDVGTLYFPRPFTNNLSFLPQSKWELLPNGGESKLWYAATPSNSLLVTWVNGLLDRNPFTPTNFQAEFFPDGSYEYRYPDHSEPHPFMLPFDCDGDGLENTVDPDPETAGPDAHNTNAEWYNVVCSNVLTAVEGLNGMELSFRDGVNSNAYYFVDVCAEMGPAPIYFTADQEGRLGSPVVVATAGVTNRVPLLVGATYSVTSSVPFSVSVPTDGFAEVTTNAANEYVVNWPVRFDFRESLDSSGRSYTVYAEPYDPGGVFTWNGSGAGGGGARLMSASTGCSCASGNGRTVTMGCARECDCGGGCVASGSFGFEGIGLAVTGGVCRCGFDDPPPPDEPSHEPDDPASFSVTFSKSAVIYEDEYQDNPGVTVPKRSTRVCITVAAYGGPNGGALSLTTRGQARLVSVDGGAIAFDPPSTLDARESYFASFVCEGYSPSESEGDVRIEGTFTENTTHAVFNQDKSLTVVRVDLRTNKDAPLNTSSSRHQYGIGEDVIFHQFPSAPSTTLDLKDATVTGSGGARMIRWGISNVVHTLKICADSAEYTPQISVVCPQRVEGCNARAYTSGLAPGVAGGLELRQSYRIHPLTVSFEELSIEEVPCDEVIPPQGYFAFTPTNIFLRSHTRGAGAGKWTRVFNGNWLGSEESFDKAGYLGDLPRMMPDGTPTANTAFGWLGGSLTWKVPFGWNKDLPTGSMADPVGRFAENTTQVFRVDEDGDFSVEKLGHKAERKITGEVNVYNTAITNDQ